jgi:hypothetical protein
VLPSGVAARPARILSFRNGIVEVQARAPAARNRVMLSLVATRHDCLPARMAGLRSQHTLCNCEACGGTHAENRFTLLYVPGEECTTLAAYTQRKMRRLQSAVNQRARPQSLA